jgi:hypothetical protein
MQFWSPYSYASNGYNPINGVDPNGKEFGLMTTSGAGSSNGFGHTTMYVGNQYLGNYVFNLYPDKHSLGVLLGAQTGAYMSMHGVSKLEPSGGALRVHTSESFQGFPGFVVDKMATFKTTVLDDFVAFYLALDLMNRIRSGEVTYDLYKANCGEAFLLPATGIGLDVAPAAVPARLYENAVDAGATEILP